MYVLDTSILFEMIDGTQKAAKAIEIMGSEMAVTTSITMHEALSGANEKDTFVLDNMAKTIDILPFAYEDSEMSSSIKKKLEKIGKTIGAMDILIAGICISHDATLVTSDNDFDRISELKKIII